MVQYLLNSILFYMELWYMAWRVPNDFTNCFVSCMEYFSIEKLSAADVYFVFATDREKVQKLTLKSSQ